VARQAVVRVIDDPVPGDDQIGSDDRGDDDGFPGSTDPHQ
jgi:hypothetical protein